MNIEERELVITRLIDASPARVYEAYTEPEQLKQWWAPRPFATPVVEIDARAGGRFRTDMQGPDGTAYPNEGVFLEVIPNQKLVFTDAFSFGWIPKPNPFMVAIITMEDEGGKTRLTAHVRHWTVEAKIEHEKMGFHDGWGTALAQLNELVSSGV